MRLDEPSRIDKLKLEYPENIQGPVVAAAGDLPIFSFFTGAGFLDLGFESQGFESKLINESHHPFIEGFNHGIDSLGIKSSPSIHHCSISEFVEGTSSLPSFSKSSAPLGFIGGPPCPDFSVAGKQRGRKGDNGKLTGSYAELICRRKPSWFLLENVKGLWRTKKHREFYDEICRNFIANGYCLTHRLVNSLEYGVPQDRERIILLGFKKGILGKRSAGFLSDAEFPWEENLLHDATEVLNLPWPDTDPYGGNPSLNIGCLKSLPFNTGLIETR